MRKPPPRLVATSTLTYAKVAAARLLIAILELLKTKPTCSVMLAGGSTPEPVYRELTAEPLFERVPWNRLQWYFGDERCVPPTDPLSNFAMVKKVLFDPAKVDPSRIHRIEAEHADRDRAAADYAKMLPDVVDVMVLGIGDDGHTASLFPGSPALAETGRKVVPIEGTKVPRFRLTITPAVIASASELVMLATGAGKAAMVAAALVGTSETTLIPARLARRGIWVLDFAAAAMLPQGLVTS